MNSVSESYYKWGHARKWRSLAFKESGASSLGLGRQMHTNAKALMTSNGSGSIVVIQRSKSTTQTFLKQLVPWNQKTTTRVATSSWENATNVWTLEQLNAQRHKKVWCVCVPFKNKVVVYSSNYRLNCRKYCKKISQYHRYNKGWHPKMNNCGIWQTLSPQLMRKCWVWTLKPLLFEKMV